MWHFCGKVNNEKIEKIQQIHVSSYDDLMSKAHVSTMLNRRLRGILCEVFKCVKGINSNCLNDFEVKATTYSLRNDFRRIPQIQVSGQCLTSVPSCGMTTWHCL